MIKNLWDKFTSWLFSWQKEKEEKDPHLQFYEDELEPEIPIHVETIKKPEHCTTHSRFKKSCLKCQEIVNG